MEARKATHTIVLDAGPILKNEPAISSLLAQSEALVTVPSVIAEIRDDAARSRVETTLLPFLTLRNPKPESVKTVADFARKTGDYEVLSRPDLQILALAYELECERNGGDWRLRKAPGQKGVNGAPPKKVEEADEEVPERDEETAADSVSSPVGDSEEAPQSQVEEPLEKSLQDLQMSSPSEEVKDHAEAIAIPAEETPDSEDSGSDGWITPSNIKKQQAKDSNTSTKPVHEQKVMQVATMTTDFAMQNVLLQMNLNLLSPSLQRVRHLKTYMLRCHACFATTKDMSRQFCSRCGQPTLLRVSCSTLDSGEFRVHLKRNMQWNTRGDRFSIPKAAHGSASGKVKGAAGGGKGGWGQGLILAEDQKEYVRAMTETKRRKERDLMDEDHLPGILTGERGRAGGRPKVGGGRNVNSKKRT
ncbi:MAG: Nin1 binding protein [Thelocarpon impressellum]|nr:MAG: Nin1 binding protein [Thelocarpon impressellum]